MKNILILLFMCSTAFAQPQQRLYSNFLNHVSHNFHNSKPLGSSCLWQYALVKLTCNKGNKVVSHQFLNTVSNEIKNQFEFVDGYQFDRKIHINQRPLIFCMTFENHSSDCIVKNKTITVEGIKEVYGQITQQIVKNPQTLFINNVLIFTYNYDPEP